MKNVYIVKFLVGEELMERFYDNLKAAEAFKVEMMSRDRIAWVTVKPLRSK